MRKNILYALLVLLTVSCGYSKNRDEVITVLDMRYTLDLDLTDQPDVELVWDHMHAIATLQGIVNRESPRLFSIALC